MRGTSKADNWSAASLVIIISSAPLICNARSTLNKALAPWIFEQLSQSDGSVRIMIVRRTYQFFIVLILVGVLAGLTADFLFDYFIDIRYRAARPLIPWMLGGFVMQGLYTSVVNFLFFAERTGWLSAISCSVASLGALISWIMVGQYGIEGAAISFAFNNALLFFLVWIAAARAVPMPWSSVRFHER